MGRVGSALAINFHASHLTRLRLSSIGRLCQICQIWEQTSNQGQPAAQSEKRPKTVAGAPALPLSDIRAAPKHTYKTVSLGLTVV